MSSELLSEAYRLARRAQMPIAVTAIVLAASLDVWSENTQNAASYAPTGAIGPQAAAAAPQGMERYAKYFAEMEEDVSVYDPASPWIYSGKAEWFKRVEQMIKIRQFLDLNQVHREAVEIGDLRVTTFYRELRRVEGSMTSRLHGRITFVHLKRPDGTWSLWHDHTSEIPMDFSYSSLEAQ